MNDSLFDRRAVLAGAASVGAGAALLAPRDAAAQKARTRRQPNILFILADDLGYTDLGCFGSRMIRTPNLDRLAAQGVRLTDAYANSPVCSPTRLALATGRYHTRLKTGLVEPFSAGAWGDQAIPAGHPTMPGELRKAGYRTALVGKWHLGETPAGGPLAHGYDEFFGFLPGGLDYFTHEYDKHGLRENEGAARREGYLTTVLADEAIARIRRFAQGSAPFFLSLHFNAPHWPWEGPEDSRMGTKAGQYDHGSLDIYARMTESMDQNIGRILTELANLNIDRDTLIVFTSDNGGERYSDVWPFRGKKGFLLEGGIRVPTILRWPERVRGGQDSPQPLATMDWMATFLDAAGVSPSRRPPLDGISILPAMTEGALVPRDLFFRFQGHKQRALRSGNWKYYQIRDTAFLFDLSVDSMEYNNQARAQPERLAAMISKWESWNAGMVTDDSILGFCDQARDVATPLDTGPGSACKPARSATAPASP